MDEQDPMQRRMQAAQQPAPQEGQAPQQAPGELPPKDDDISSNTYAVLDGLHLMKNQYPDLYKEYGQQLEIAATRGFAKDYRDLSKGVKLA